MGESPRGDVNYHELSILFSRFMQKKPSLFSMIVERSKFVLCRVLTVAQVVDVKALLHIPMATFRKLRIMLSKFGVKIFPSEPKMRREMISRIEHLKDAQMECEELLMEDVSGDRLLKEIPVLMSKNLIGYISSVFLKLQENGNLFFADPDSTVQIAIGGDKGGDSMKFHFQICHPETSVFDVHIFCMYEGSDCPANMRRALNCFITDFTKMVEPDFRLDGHKVQFLLGGDFKFLDGVLGHMGSSATYPSSKDYVSKDHLQSHGGSPHTPDHCGIPLRSVQELEDCYNENLSDNRGSGNFHPNLNLNKTGRHHSSVSRRNLFPFVCLDNIVPPVLHITLGIVLKLFNLLLSKCRVLDSVDSKSH